VENAKEKSAVKKRKDERKVGLNGIDKKNKKRIRRRK